jgi:hypothetical protein
MTLLAAAAYFAILGLWRSLRHVFDATHGPRLAATVLAADRVFTHGRHENVPR